MKYLIIFLAISFLPLNGYSQSSYDLNVLVTKNDRVNGGDFWVKIQVRKTPGFPDFQSGNFSQGITYNPLALSITNAFNNVSATAYTWDPIWTDPVTGYNDGPVVKHGQNPPPPGSTGTEIAIGRSHDLLSPDFVPVVISNNWIDVITLKFKIVDNTKKLQIDRLGGGNNPAAQQWANTTLNPSTGWFQVNQSNGFFYDKVTYTAGTWVGGNGLNGMPNATDAAKELIMTSNGTTADTATLTGNVEVDYFEIPTNCRLKLAAGATMRPFNQASSTYIHTQPTQFVLTADGNASGVQYSQYIGPSVPGRIQQYVGTDPGWRNMAFPVASSSAAANGLSFGGAPINFNTLSTSWHTSSSTRDACGGFGNWINTVNVYNFRGTESGLAPHEWYGANENNVGGTLGYSVFLGNSFFPTSGTVEVKGQFNAGSLTYDYEHSTPHALLDPNASQALYLDGAGCTGPPEQGNDRKNNWDGWALVANPYPSGLDVNTFADNNSIARSNVRVWNRGKTFAIVGNGGIDYQYQSMENNIVPPMQAFFVKVGGNGDNFTFNFNDGQRAFSTQDFLKTAAEQVKLIGMNLADSAINHTILAFDANATDGYDIAYDSYVLSQPRNSTPQMGIHYEYTTNGQTVVAPLYVNTVADNQPSGSYPLRFWSRSNGNFNFSLDRTLLNPGWRVYIEDLKVAPGASVEITNQPYAFSYNTSDDVKRFILHYVNTTIGIDEFTQGGWNAIGWFNADQQMEISFNGSLLPDYVSVTVTDLAGKLLYQSNRVSTQGNLVLASRFASGLYLVNIQHEIQGFKLLKVLKEK
jgi:hypothetical protein